MKKFFLIALMACCSLMSHAADKQGVMYLTSPAGYQVLSISENGLWACGMYSDDSETTYGFRWNLTNGKIDLFAANTEAYTVSNDGQVAGSYYTKEVTGSSLQVPGIWKDGWTMLELPNKKGGWAYAITPDGHHVTGTDNSYVSYIWKDGKLEYTAKVNSLVAGVSPTFITFAISPDGSKIGGWAYYSDDNRNPGYWDTADQKFHELNAGEQGSPWQAVKKFSPDGKKVLYWGGYHQDPLNADKGYGIDAIYDLETKQKSIIYPMWADPFNFDLFDMGGNGSVVGYIQDDEGLEYGIIYADGKTQYIESYLTARGADFSGMNMLDALDDLHMIFRAMAISSDEKKFGVVYYDQNYNYRSLIVMLDQQTSMMPPVQVEATQVLGLMVAEISWAEPLGDKTTLQGYNVYRDGVKLNSEMLTSTTYYDKNLQQGSYQYTVSAVYAEGESSKSDASILTIEERQPQQPRSLMARQKGYASLLAQWEAPSTNYTQCHYYGDGTSSMDGFGGGDISFETGTLFPAERVSLYAGHRLVGVSFVPKSEQGSWIINVYRHVDGKLTLLKSVPVTQQLEYGQKNVVTLPQPLTLQDGQDLLIGVQTNVTEPSYDIQAVYDNCLKEGYTDLLRQVGEDDFYSINMMSPNAGYDIAWATAALLAPADMKADVDALDHYNVYIDGSKKTETKELCYEDNTLAEGQHSVGVQVIYADGRQSANVDVQFTLTHNDDVLRITPRVSVEDGKMTASWEAPVDNDPTQMSYCSDTPASRHPSATADVTEIIARVDFTPTELRSYEGYEIKSLSFYPMSNASFELQLFEDGEDLIYIPVDEFSIGEWNTIVLDEGIPVRKGKNYYYCVVCYDCPAGLAPMAMDNRSSLNDYSCLIKSAGEDGWYRISDETAYDGNWMMRMGIAAPGGTALPVTGYDIYIDRDRKAANQTATQYVQQFDRTDNTDHTVRVDAIYSQPQQTIQGTTVTFNLQSTPVEAIKAVTSGVPLYNLAGQRVSEGYKGIVVSKGKTMLKR